jgi:hypothetical protein
MILLDSLFDATAESDIAYSVVEKVLVTDPDDEWIETRSHSRVVVPEGEDVHMFITDTLGDPGPWGWYEVEEEEL